MKGCGCYLPPAGSYNRCGQVKRTLNAIFGEEEDIMYCKECSLNLKPKEVSP